MQAIQPNSAWENPANWSSNKVPDANKDVTVAGGNVVIGTNAICRSLAVSISATVAIKPASVLTLGANAADYLLHQAFK